MKDIEIKIHLQLKHENELDDAERDLIEKAKQATFRSYAPYSNFSVGAALMLENGKTLTGSNQENCAYPSGLCAERTTLFYANSRFPDQKIRCLAIAARDTTGEFTKMPISPCGACRQVFIEVYHRQKAPFKVLLYGTDGTYIVESPLDLMPISFDSSYL